MFGYIIRRLIGTIPTLVIVSIAVFVLMRLVPGDPALLILGDGADQRQLADLRRSMGLDQPVVVQYVSWVSDVLRGDFGRSTATGAQVLPLILERFTVTATIVLAALGLAALVAVPLGMIAAWRQDRWLDLGIVAMATLLLSIPSFWLGLIFLLIFGVWLPWFPVVGYVPFSEDPWRAFTFVVLPITTLMLIEIGILTRMARSATIDVLRLDYIAHARAKGLSERTVLARHAFPNAFAPTMTLMGIVLGGLLGGIAVTETVFTLPGLGRLLVDSIYARDYPVIQGALIFIAVIYVLVNLLVDLLYPLFDPRVTAE